MYLAINTAFILLEMGSKQSDAAFRQKANSAPGACEIQLDLSVPFFFFCTRIYEYPNLASTFPSALCYRHLDVCTWLLNVTVTLCFKDYLTM